MTWKPATNLDSRRDAWAVPESEMRTAFIDRTDPLCSDVSLINSCTHSTGFLNADQPTAVANTWRSYENVRFFCDTHKISIGCERLNKTGGWWSSGDAKMHPWQITACLTTDTVMASSPAPPWKHTGAISTDGVYVFGGVLRLSLSAILLFFLNYNHVMCPQDTL